MDCKKCGRELKIDAIKCDYCGEYVTDDVTFGKEYIMTVDEIIPYKKEKKEKKDKVAFFDRIIEQDKKLKNAGKISMKEILIIAVLFAVALILGILLICTNCSKETAEIQSVEFNGYTFASIDSYTLSVTDIGVELNSKDGKVRSLINIYNGNYAKDVVEKVESLKATLTDIGYTITKEQTVTVEEKEFMVFETEYNNTKYLVGYSTLSDIEYVFFREDNDDQTYDYNYLNDLTAILNSVKFTGK